MSAAGADEEKDTFSVLVVGVRMVVVGLMGQIMMRQYWRMIS
jgi:hypothetical protein